MHVALSCRVLWIHGHVYVFLAILGSFAPLPILTPHPGQDLHAIAHCFEHFAHVLCGIGIAAVRAAVEGRHSCPCQFRFARARATVTGAG